MLIKAYVIPITTSVYVYATLVRAISSMECYAACVLANTFLELQLKTNTMCSNSLKVILVINCLFLFEYVLCLSPLIVTSSRCENNG